MHTRTKRAIGIALFALIALLFLAKKASFTETSTTTFSYENVEPISKAAVSKIVLLIADTSVIDPSRGINPPMLKVRNEAGFVDSNGKPFLRPSQEIVFTDSTKDEFIEIFNSYLKVPQDTTIRLNCSVIYRHAFQLYDANGALLEQVHLCLSCAKLYFTGRKAFVQFLENENKLYAQLKERLKQSGAYLLER